MFIEVPKPEAGKVAHDTRQGVVVMTEADWQAVQKFVGSTLRSEGIAPALIEQMKSMTVVPYVEVEDALRFGDSDLDDPEVF